MIKVYYGIAFLAIFLALSFACDRNWIFAVLMALTAVINFDNIKMRRLKDKQSEGSKS